MCVCVFGASNQIKDNKTKMKGVGTDSYGETRAEMAGEQTSGKDSQYRKGTKKRKKCWAEMKSVKLWIYNLLSHEHTQQEAHSLSSGVEAVRSQPDRGNPSLVLQPLA